MSERTVSEKIYALLLRLYPRGFQDEYGPQMQLLFRDRLMLEKGISRMGLWLDVLIDLAASVPREYRRPSGVIRVHPMVEAAKGSLAIIFGVWVMAQVAFWGGASHAWVTVIFLLALEWAFLVLLHGSKTPAWEYSLDGEAITIRAGRTQAVQIRGAEVVRILQGRDGLVVFGSDGTQVPVYSSVVGYGAIREQLATWAPIEVMPSYKVPDGTLVLAYVATLLMTNPWAVSLLGVGVAAGIVHRRIRPNLHPQTTVNSRGGVGWIASGIALAVLAGKVCITLSSL